MITLEDRPQPLAAEHASMAAARSDAARRARIGVALLLLGVAWACLPFLAGLLGAAALCVVVWPLQRRLARRLEARASALLITVASALLLAAPGAWLLSAAAEQAPIALRRLTASEGFARMASLRLGSVDIGARVADLANAVVGWVSAHALAAVGSLTLAVINLLLALVGLYYLLLEGPAIWRTVRRYIPFSPEGRDRLAERFVSVTEAALLGIAAAAAAQAFIVGAAFWLVGLPNPLFWGVVTGAVSVLPIFGASLVWVPGVVVLALQGRPTAAIALGLVGVVVASNVDNVVRPLVYRRVSGMHPMVSLVGAFAGVKAFGLPGLLLGPLALTYALELWRLYESEYGGDEPMVTGLAARSTVSHD